MYHTNACMVYEYTHSFLILNQSADNTAWTRFYWFSIIIHDSV